MDPNEMNLEKIKMIYDKVAEHHRYFLSLSWRHFLFAGSIAVFSALFYSSYLLFEKGGINTIYAIIILLVNGSLSLIFVSLDKRNRVLYRTCQKVGGNIEELLLSKDFNEKSAELFDVSKKDLFAIFYKLDISGRLEEKVNESVGSHSHTLNIYYYGVAVLSFLSCILNLFQQFI